MKQPLPPSAPDAAFLRNVLGPLPDADPAEQALRFQAMVLEQVLDAVIAIDNHQRVTYLNAAAERQYGVTADDALGRPLRELYEWRWNKPEDESAACEALNTKGLWRGENTHVRRDGTSLDVESVVSILKDPEGHAVGLLAAVRDITHRKRAQEALRESQQRFARFMQHLPGLAWIKDTAGRYVFANEAAMRAFRTSSAELPGKTDEELFPSPTAAEFRDNDRRALASESGIQTVESLEHEDGVVHHSIVSKFPIPGRDGNPALIGGMAIDITERMRAEEALRQADRRKDEFLATLAHELRNPLAPIRNAVAVLRLAAGDDAKQQWCREIIDRQVAQMGRLLDDLLDAGRITRGKLVLRQEPITLEQAVANAIETSRPLIDEQGHELTVTLPAEPVTLNADLTRLAQVLSNLLINAAKYTEQGGHIWLTAEVIASDKQSPATGAASPASGGRQPPGFVVVTVRDDGIGIDPAHLPRIFEMFSQADVALDRSQGGLGIGLSLVRGLVELHGGTVEAKSDGLGQGSQFIVRLPLYAPLPAGTAPSDQDHTAVSRLKCRVLVADDNQDSANTMAMILRLMGHEVSTAYGGQQAVELTGEFRPEVVLLDLGMPKLTGYDACRSIRQQPWGREMVLIAMTGWGQQEDRRRTHEAGFNHHLVKPIDIAELAKLLGDSS